VLWFKKNIFADQQHFSTMFVTLYVHMYHAKPVFKFFSLENVKKLGRYKLSFFRRFARFVGTICIRKRLEISIHTIIWVAVLVLKMCDLASLL
jgi:hypothetical protein